MSENPKRFEKQDDHTLRIILEKIQAVPVTQLLANKKQLEEQRDQILNVLKNVNEMLAEAKKLGLTPAPVETVEKSGENTIKEGKVNKGGRNSKPITLRPENPKKQK